MFSNHCDYCQSFSDGYYCSHPTMIYVDEKGKKQARDCFFEYGNFDECVVHPCPFFKGEIRSHFKSGYLVRKVLQENTLFTKSEWIPDE